MTPAADAESPPRRSAFGALFVSALGVVFGDIGTSPLYALKEAFAGPHPLPIDAPHVLGVLSLVFWSLICVVSIKYVAVVMRADNRGEGGSLALLALLARAPSASPRLVKVVGALGIFAAALFYGDSMITPAISVLSAVEGLGVVAPALDVYEVPITVGILVALFSLQSKGTATVGVMFGPVMLVWFSILLAMGLANIHLHPGVLAALSPHHAVAFLVSNKLLGFLSLGSVVLVVTGAEALYADMGHFGRWPIRLAWSFVVLPSLMVNYLGQGALLLSDPATVENPFYLMAPHWARMPLLALAAFATVIASQAVISGAFSLTQQAIQLGFLPRMTIVHTSERERGQIYLPFVNWALLLFVVCLVAGFGSSSNLASAYGIAVTGNMAITTVLVGLVMVKLWGWRNPLMKLMIAAFLTMDFGFFFANVGKIPHGGWFPLAMALAIFVLLTTWKRGRELLLEKRVADSLPLDAFFDGVANTVTRVKGTAMFLTGKGDGVPTALMHNLKHNQVLHERIVLLSTSGDERPYVPPEERVSAVALGPNFHRVVLTYGFMDDPNVPKALANARLDCLGFFYEPMTTSYFVSRENIAPARLPGMARWRVSLFAWMNRTATTITDFLHLPIGRVVELGGQVEI
ncbi:putative potassium transport system protein kup 2 [uncultured Alphaproteobacteria bacterium]|uniref:Probable potassium transport system protein Kup n=1 Tax=uncultured Alphaproteobacteria bacterium TaxID=91750 RepID=A0A212KJ53_9PROT|nr:putative potassium transport system protein kup 2 [uncultured Alphaproteobacteria bacterium]